jgi:DNA-binding NarL/FixJ family response regulator
MKSSVAIISDDILFDNLLSPLIKQRINDVEIPVCRNYIDINAKVESTQCDLIILDGGISHVSSIELIRYLRIKKQVVAPIWFFAEIQNSEYFQKAMELGANRIIKRPFDPKVIAHEIGLIFNKVTS